MRVGSFYRRVCSSFKAALISFASHFALARINCASVRPQFCFVTFSSNLMALIRYLGGAYPVGMGFDPQ